MSIALNNLIKSVSNKILKLIKEDNVLPSDIMILLNKRNPIASPLIKELQNLNIKTSGIDRIILNEYAVIIDLLNLIRFCIDTSYDYALACILKSPLFRYNEKKLYEVCLIKNNDNISLLEALKKYDLYSYEECIYYSEISKIYPPYSFFMEILRRNNNKIKIYENFGESVIDPLDEFLNITLSYQRSNSGFIKHFLQWFMTRNTEIKRDLEKTTGVRITTVHSSKGLESKIVFLIDTLSTPNLQKDKIINYDNDIWFWIEKSNINFVKELKNKLMEEKLQEYYRLLYVALTRARDRLYIYGYSNSEKISENSWYYNLREIIKK